METVNGADTDLMPLQLSQEEEQVEDTKLSESPESLSGATTPLSGEDTMSTAPTEELERSATQPIDLLRINKEGLRREVSQGVRVEDSSEQGLTFSFSSEAPSFVEASDAEWRQRLTPGQYAVTRQGGTERAFSGVYWNHKGSGTYHCVCCGAELFSSASKFDSGTGWPSFWEGVDSGAIKTLTDSSHGMVRTEIRCARCA